MGDTLRRDMPPFGMCPEWVNEHPKISGNAVRLYLAIWHYADKSGTAFPSRATLAARIHVSERTIGSLLNELVAIGALTIGKRKSGPNSGNLYTLHVAPPVMGDRGAGRTLPDDDAGSGSGLPSVQEANCLRFRRQTAEEPYPDEPNPGNQTNTSAPHRDDERPVAAAAAADEEIIDAEIIEGDGHGTLSLIEYAAQPQAPDFETWWRDEWPGPHRGKKPAAEAFKKATRRASYDEILEGTRHYATAVHVGLVNPAYRKWAQGWLNDDRWTDRYSAADRPMTQNQAAAWAERQALAALAQQQQPKENPPW